MTINSILCLIALAAAPIAVSQEPIYQVVVNTANPALTLSRGDVSRIFLKRQPTWKHGGPILPVDLERSSKTREAFTRAVHSRSVSAIGTFWQQQIFAGKQTPPPEKPKDDDVLAYVRSNPNAIGYVSTGTALGSGVKAVTLTQ
jgi:ABC-type phosphate transport system substrate-binding protein